MSNLIWAFWNAAEKRLRTGWRLLLQLLAGIVMMAVVITLIVIVLQPDLESTSFMVLGAIIQNVVIVGAVIVACYWPDRRRVKDLGLDLNRRWWLDLIGGIFLGAVLMTLVFAIEYQQGWIQISDAKPDWSRLWTLQFGWIVSMLFVGVGEEIFSRGYHLKNLTEGFAQTGILTSFIIATLISSGVFGVLHAINPNAAVIATLGVVMAGIMFCVARVCTGSLAAGIGMHFAWNYFQGAVFGFPVSGNLMEGSLIVIDSTIESIWTGGAFGPEAGLMGLICIGIATLVFAFWPARRTNWKENMFVLSRLRRRVRIKKSVDTNSNEPDPVVNSTDGMA